jgi:hypothetical protein
MERKLNREEIANPEEIPLLDDLECTIDMMISLNPYICRKCENVFCRECIGNWTKKSSNCPMRCNPFDYTSIEKSILKTQINKIKLFCCNKSSGCIEICLVQEKEKHEKTCEYRSIQCNKCKSLVPEKIMNEHYYQACEKMKIRCNLCNENFNLYNFITHLEQCFKKIQHCEFCFRRILISNKNPNAVKEHFEKCLSKVDFCKICQMPEFSDKIEYMHKHDINANFDEIMSKLFFNFKIFHF